MGKPKAVQTTYEKLSGAVKQLYADQAKPLYWRVSRQAYVDLLMAAYWEGVDTDVIKADQPLRITELYGIAVMTVDNLGAGIMELVAADGQRVTLQIDRVPPYPNPVVWPSGIEDKW